MADTRNGWYRAAELASGGHAVEVYYREDKDGDMRYMIDVYHETNKGKRLTDAFAACAAYDSRLGAQGIEKRDLAEIGSRAQALIERLSTAESLCPRF